MGISEERKQALDQGIRDVDDFLLADQEKRLNEFRGAHRAGDGPVTNYGRAALRAFVKVTAARDTFERTEP
jgi:hypothetical protein